MIQCESQLVVKLWQIIKSQTTAGDNSRGMSNFAVANQILAEISPMHILIYCTSDQQNDDIVAFIKTFDLNATCVTFQEPKMGEGYHLLLDTLRENDIVVFYSLREVFTTTNPFLMFLKYCKSKEARIISIADEIDSEDKIFPLPSSVQWMKILCGLKTSVSKIYDDAQAETIGSDKKETILKKHRMVINLYSAGYSTKDILRLTGYKGKDTCLCS